MITNSQINVNTLKSSNCDKPFFLTDVQVLYTMEGIYIYYDGEIYNSAELHNHLQHVRRNQKIVHLQATNDAQSALISVSNTMPAYEYLDMSDDLGAKLSKSIKSTNQYGADYMLIVKKAEEALAVSKALMKAKPGHYTIPDLTPKQVAKVKAMRENGLPEGAVFVNIQKYIRCNMRAAANAQLNGAHGEFTGTDGHSMPDAVIMQHRATGIRPSDPAIRAELLSLADRITLPSKPVGDTLGAIYSTADTYAHWKTVIAAPIANATVNYDSGLIPSSAWDSNVFEDIEVILNISYTNFAGGGAAADVADVEFSFDQTPTYVGHLIPAQSPIGLNTSYAQDRRTLNVSSSFPSYSYTTVFRGNGTTWDQGNTFSYFHWAITPSVGSGTAIWTLEVQMKAHGRPKMVQISADTPTLDVNVDNNVTVQTVLDPVVVSSITAPIVIGNILGQTHVIVDSSAPITVQSVTSPVHVIVDSSIPISTNTIIVDVRIPDQTSSLNVNQVSSIKYDHTGKEPNDTSNRAQQREAQLMKLHREAHSRTMSEWGSDLPATASAWSEPTTSSSSTSDNTHLSRPLLLVKGGTVSNAFSLLLTLPDTCLTSDLQDFDDDVLHDGSTTTDRPDRRSKKPKLNPTFTAGNTSSQNNLVRDNQPSKDSGALCDTSLNGAPTSIATNSASLAPRNKSDLFSLAVKIASTIRESAHDQTYPQLAISFARRSIKDIVRMHGRGKVISRYILRVVSLRLGLLHVYDVLRLCNNVADVATVCSLILVNHAVADENEAMHMIDQISTIVDRTTHIFVGAFTVSDPYSTVTVGCDYSRGIATTKHYDHTSKEPNDMAEANMTEENGNIEQVSVDFVPHTEDQELANAIGQVSLAGPTHPLVQPDSTTAAWQFLNTRLALENYVRDVISEEIGHYANPAEIDAYISAGARSASGLDRVVTAISNALGPTPSNYIGPGYTGGAHTAIRTLPELVERYMVRPSTDLDAIARIHDLMRTIRATPRGAEGADRQMVQIIDSIQNPDIQTSMARFLIANLAGAYARLMPSDSLIPVHDEATNAIILTPNGSLADYAQDTITAPVPDTPLQPVSIPPSQPHPQGTGRNTAGGTVEQNFDYRRRRPAPTNRDMHAYNGNTFNYESIIKGIATSLTVFSTTHADLKSPFGFALRTTSNNTNNFDFQYWLNYLRFRTAVRLEKLVYLAFNVETPVDGYTAWPLLAPPFVAAATVPNMTLVFDPIAGIGPLLTLGPVCKPFVQTDEANVNLLITSLRTNNAILSQTSNYAMYMLVRDIGVATSSDPNSSLTVGSNSMILAKIWGLMLLMGATTDVAPTQNKFDNLYTIPANTAAINPAVPGSQYFPTYGIPDIALRFWSTTSIEMMSSLYSSSVTVAPLFNKAKAFYINITTDLLDLSNTRSLAAIVAAHLPGPIISGLKRAEVFDSANNAGVVLSSGIDNSSIDTNKSVPLNAAGVRYFDIVFVLTSWNATSQGMALTADFSVPLNGARFVNSNVALPAGQNNNCFDVNGAFVPDLDPVGGQRWLMAGLSQMQAGWAGGDLARAQTWWAELYGTPDDVERALTLLSHMSTRFMNPPMVNTTMTVPVGGSIVRIENVVSSRIVNAPDYPAVRMPTATVANFNSAMAFRDMFGNYCSQQNVNRINYMYSNMSVKTRLAMALGILIPVEGRMPAWDMRTPSPEQIAIFTYELASAHAAMYTSLYQNTYRPPTRFLVMEQVGNIGHSEAIFQNQVLVKMLDATGVGQFITFRSPNWVVPPAGNMWASYSVPPLVLPDSQSMAEWYTLIDQPDKRDASQIVDHSSMVVSPFTRQELGIVGGIINLGIKEGQTTQDMKKFMQLWQPSLVTLGLTVLNNYTVPLGMALLIVDTAVRLAFPVFNPMLLSSARNMYATISQHAPLGLALLTPFVQGCVLPPILYTSSPQTGKVTQIAVGVNDVMSSYLLGKDNRIFQANDQPTLSVQGYRSADLVLDDEDFLKAMKAVCTTSQQTEATESKSAVNATSVVKLPNNVANTPVGSDPSNTHPTTSTTATMTTVSPSTTVLAGSNK